MTFLSIVLAVIVFAAIGAHFFKNQAGLSGAVAPPIQLNEWITPRPMSQSDLDGRVYVIEFWATWCGPCVRAIPHTIELANKYKDVPFIAVSVDNSSEPVKKMVKDKGINYYVAMDNGLADKFSLSSIPATFVIGRSGRIVWQGHPMKPGFETAIVKALNAPQPVDSDKE